MIQIVTAVVVAAVLLLVPAGHSFLETGAIVPNASGATA